MRPWLFALYLRSYGPEPAALPEPTTASHVQPLLLYAAIAGTFVLDFLTGEHTTVDDALGQTWRTGDIYEASVLTTIYRMFFTVLAALSLAPAKCRRGQPDRRQPRPFCRERCPSTFA